MHLRITYDDGMRQEVSDSDILFIRAHPPSETPKPGYEKTRDCPPEFSKFTPLLASVLTAGAYVSTGGKMVQVKLIEHLD